MNLIITKEEHEILQGRILSKNLIGSKLYGIDGADTDYLCIYAPFEEEIFSGLPNIHQFQYTENGIDYIYTSQLQFWKNLYSGDSTINADVIMFYNTYNNKEKLELCRTFKVIKSF